MCAIFQFQDQCPQIINTRPVKLVCFANDIYSDLVFMFTMSCTQLLGDEGDTGVWPPIVTGGRGWHWGITTYNNWGGGRRYKGDTGVWPLIITGGGGEIKVTLGYDHL